MTESLGSPSRAVNQMICLNIIEFNVDSIDYLRNSFEEALRVLISPHL